MAGAAEKRLFEIARRQFALVRRVIGDPVSFIAMTAMLVMFMVLFLIIIMT